MDIKEFKKMYAMIKAPRNKTLYRFKNSLEIGKEYDGVVFTPKMEEKKGKEFEIVKEGVLTSIIKIDGCYYPVSRPMITASQIIREYTRIPVLRKGMYVRIKPDVSYLFAYSGTYATNEMVRYGEREELFEINTISVCYDNEDACVPYVRYTISNGIDEFYVSDNQIIPVDKQTASEIIKERKRKAKEKEAEKKRKLKDLSPEIKTSLVNTMITALDEREYDYSRKALEAMVDEWFCQKYELIKLLEKHPKWNPEKFMIQFDMNVERERDSSTINTAVSWFRQRNIEHNNTASKDNILYYLTYIPTTIDEEFASLMHDLMESDSSIDERYYPVVGTKATRWVNKLIKNVFPEIYNNSNYNRVFAKFADAVNPLIIKRHTCLSLNPTDFLLQANGNSWRSCHYIGHNYDDAGCYCSGTVSYMLDKVSMTFYTVSGDYDGDAIELQKKVTRNMFAYENGKLLQQRIYPQATDGSEDIYVQYRNVVQEIIAHCEDKANLWKTNHNASYYCEKGEGSTMYHDWLEQDSSLSSMSFLNEIENASNTDHKLVIGAKPLSIVYEGKYTRGGSDLYGRTAY